MREFLTRSLMECEKQTLRQCNDRCNNVTEIERLFYTCYQFYNSTQQALICLRINVCRNLESILLTKSGKGKVFCTWQKRCHPISPIFVLEFKYIIQVVTIAQMGLLVSFGTFTLQSLFCQKKASQVVSVKAAHKMLVKLTILYEIFRYNFFERKLFFISVVRR